MIIKLALLTAIGIALNSCHPSDSGSSISPAVEAKDPEKKSVSLRGVVADGYIAGADVCVYLGNVEINCTKSDENGSYSFPPHLFSPNAAIDINATGGIDTASGKEYSGTLLRHIELDADLEQNASIVANITPLSDLVSNLVSQESNVTLADIKELIAVAYSINEREEINADPMQENSLFVASQDIERSKELLKTMAQKLYADSLTNEEIQAIQKEIRKALAKSAHDSAKESREVSIPTAIKLLEGAWQKNVPKNHANFVETQRDIIVAALKKFVESDELNLTSRAEFQKELVGKVDESLKILEEHEGDEYFLPLPIDIDIFAPEPTQPDDENQTTDPDDENQTTIPDDENQTTEPEPKPEYTITGVVVDGYISGATLCIDTNADAMCGTNEPRATTQEDGSFSITTQELEESRYYRVIAFGGRDASTQKDFVGEYQGVLSTASLQSNLFMTPLNDMVARMFFRSSEGDASSLQAAQKSIAEKLGVNITDLESDPMSLKKLILASTGIESVYAVFSSVLKSHLDISSLSSSQEKIVRESMLEEFLDSGYSAFSGSRSLIRMELKLNSDFSESLHDFARDQIEENIAQLSNLNYPNGIERDAFENIQRIFDRELSVALETNSYRDINISVEVVLHSKFDKSGAVFDKNACVQNDIYSNTHTQTRDAQRYSDMSNGIIMGFDTTQSSETQSFTLFYPPLGDITKSDVLVRFERDFFFSYDAAWIGTQKSVYLEVPTTDELSKCYRIKLDKLYGSHLELVPVFQYTDAP